MANGRKFMETNSDDATRDVWERDSEKKLRSRTESSVKESQRTLPLNVAISKKGTVKLNQYGKWAKVMETNSDDATRDVWERDSEKNKVTDRILCQRVSTYIAIECFHGAEVQREFG